MSDNRRSSSEHVMEKFFFRASATDFKKIPGDTISYWLTENTFNAFKGGSFSDVSSPAIGMQSGDNNRFFRLWHELSKDKINKSIQSMSDTKGVTWSPLQRGGDYRKWFGSDVYIVNLSFEGSLILSVKNASLRNSGLYFKESVCWNRLSQGRFMVRYVPSGFAFDDLSPFSVPGKERAIFSDLALLGSNAASHFVGFISSGFKTEVGHVAKIPLPYKLQPQNTEENAKALVFKAKSDWDSYETSWDFISIPLLRPDHLLLTLKASYHKLRAHWRDMTLEMQRLEEENNRIFINAYGLQDELTPDVPLNEITLTCNPHYRYGSDKTDEELEALLLADTMRELVSYAVGCMFGRYSLDKPGLILANQGETLQDYLAQVPEPRFPADDDNVIPMLDDDWFADDITLRFRQFLRVAFGEAHYEENLAFITQALNVKGKRNYSLRDFFLGEFYTDHLKRYKKRPIYWLFSSPKGSFNALIYMHRYRPDTVSVVLRYLREFRAKLATERDRQGAVSINPASSQADKTRAIKEMERLGKVLSELDDYERDVLYPLATEQITIDLDDGVKANYPKFGAALKKIPGLDAKDED